MQLIPRLLLATGAFIAPAWATDAGNAAERAGRIPIESFFTLPAVTQARVSPDGTKIAFLFPHERRLALGVFEMKTKEAKLVVSVRNESIDSYRWKGNERLVFRADYQGNESDFIGSTDLSGKHIRRITESIGARGGSFTLRDVVHWLPSDPDHVVLHGFVGSDPSPRVVKMHVATGDRTALFTPVDLGPDEIYGNYVTDGQARVRFARHYRYRGRQVGIMHRRDNGERFAEVRTHPWDSYLESWSWLVASDRGDRLFVVSREQNDRGVLHRFDEASGSLGEVVFEPPVGEITSLVWAADRNQLVGIAYEADRTHYHWFDPQEERIHAMLQASLPGLEVHGVNQSDDGMVRLVRAGSDREPGVYFVLDLRGGTLNQFKRVREGIDPSLMRPMNPFRFKARDGSEISGYLTKPWSAVEGMAPTIVMPHGGPFGVRDSWGFDPEVQFFASRGYAVLQINFRGSGGFGDKFLLAGRRQWGRAMQDDLTDAVKWAIGAGHADPDRIAIYGTSYGGFAALAGVTLTPELYRCAINYVGLSDLEITGRARGADAWMTASDYDYRAEWIGETKAYRDVGNPITMIERIKVPTLHAYGRNDPRISDDHWIRLERELKRHGKHYEILRRKDEGHGFSGEEAKLEFYTRVERFLAENLKPRR